VNLKEAAKNIALTAFYLGIGITASAAFMQGTAKVQEDRETVTANERQIIDDDLVTAIIQVESSGNPKAISNKGAYGLMQIKWSVWKDELKKAGIAKEKHDLFNPRINIEAGKYILAHYMDKHDNNLKAALNSYSGGAKRYYEKVMEAHP
jgi:soluble lytic murein transglycosylase-like protein